MPIKNQLILAGSAAIVVLACSELTDPRAVDAARAFRLEVADTSLDADGVASTAVVVVFDTAAKSDLKVTFQTDVGYFAGTGMKSVDLAIVSNRASTRLVSDTVPRIGVVTATINGVRHSQSITFEPTPPGRVVIVPERTSAVANGADAISLQVHVLQPASGRYVTRGQTVEVEVLDSMRVVIPELTRFGVFSGGPVTLRLVSPYTGRMRAVARVGNVRSDSTILIFNPPATASTN